LDHFNGSKEELVIDLLSSLASDFKIFKENDLYMLLQRREKKEEEKHNLIRTDKGKREQ
jgi:hypothetical protein